MTAMNAAITPTSELDEPNSALWSPTGAQIQSAQVSEFMKVVNARYQLSLKNYDDLWQWSVENIAGFWSEFWDFSGIIGEKGAELLRDPHKMPGAEFFPEASLNYTENMLHFCELDQPESERQKDAVVFWGEDKVKRHLSRADLYDQVSRLSQFLAANGVGKGDRVAGFVANTPEALIGMLATASLGAIWSSASPDFGTQGVLDRFGQIKPKILIATEGYYYNGKEIDCLPKISEIVSQMPSLEHVILAPYLRDAESVNKALDATNISKSVVWNDALSPFETQPINYVRGGFNDALYIMFSSGTTGEPKCIVHGAGGTLIQHLKEHMMQCDTRADDRVFYFTTCGWMMWNWQVTALATGATLCLYDGSPFAAKPDLLFDYADAEKFTLFGTSAKYIDALNKNNIRPKDTHDLSSVRAMTSTGSPLVHESFDYVYNSIKSDLHLASISGGTDIVSCFVLGSPICEVHRGEIQRAGLGLHVDAADDDGNSLGRGEGKGELVCRKPFPCMPIGFWNDINGEKYHAAYFERFDNIWAHGDWIEQTEHGGWIIYGRSDATLNPGGVRIGTAEIYRQVEQIEDVIESIAVGQDTGDGDVRVVLGVILRDGAELSDALQKDIKTRIKSGASPRHVPAVIFQVRDIPRTKSGKITEIAVRDVIHGREVKNQHALANAECLSEFADREELTL
jgi:acetoacetyl-CoA synthetase